MARTPVAPRRGAWPLVAAITLVLLSACRDPAQPPDPGSPAAPGPGLSTPDTPQPSNLTSGPTGRDYAHPWVVRVAGNRSCHGTVIHPRWVLTAAHCVTTGDTATEGVRKIANISYTRVDPSGATHTATREQINGVGLQVHLHELYRHGFAEHDIALVRLATPFEIAPGLQTAAIPASPRANSIAGTVATYNFDGLQPGRVGLFRGAVPAGAGPSFTVLRSNPADALDETDSGSGIVTQEDGRAVLRGVASLGGANRDPSFTDVYEHRAWILGKLGTSHELLEGFTRVARRGGAADGVMALDCPNSFGAMSGPMYADGASIGANCSAGQPQRVECIATRELAGTVVAAATPFGITEFSMRTNCPPHSNTVQQLPHGQQQAVFNGPAARSPDPVGICIREFTCRAGAVEPPVLDQ